MYEGANNGFMKPDWYDNLHPLAAVNTTRDRALHARRRRVWNSAFTTKGFSHLVDTRVYISDNFLSSKSLRRTHTNIRLATRAEYRCHSWTTSKYHSRGLLVWVRYYGRPHFFSIVQHAAESRMALCHHTTPRSNEILGAFHTSTLAWSYRVQHPTSDRRPRLEGYVCLVSQQNE